MVQKDNSSIPKSEEEHKEPSLGNIERTIPNYIREDENDIWHDFNTEDESAFIFIYNRYYKELLSFGRQLCRDKQLAEDCIQDMFIDLRRKRGHLPPIKSSIRAYLYQILKNSIYDRKVKRKELHIDEGIETEKVFEIVLSEESHLIEAEEQRILSQKLQKCLQNLTPRQREVLYYLFYKNMSYDEVRVIMGFENVKSVRNLFYSTVDILKVHMKLSIFLLFCHFASW
ncbi:MAG: RNA polymerase sigma factor [Cyclobacteriaceae bacterium]|nr:RNA polymerase sigma factor [Cyclobacteriaceae bacterium]